MLARCLHNPRAYRRPAWSASILAAAPSNTVSILRLSSLSPTRPPGPQLLSETDYLSLPGLTPESPPRPYPAPRYVIRTTPSSRTCPRWVICPGPGLDVAIWANAGIRGKSSREGDHGHWVAHGMCVMCVWGGEICGPTRQSRLCVLVPG